MHSPEISPNRLLEGVDRELRELRGIAEQVPREFISTSPPVKIGRNTFKITGALLSLHFLWFYGSIISVIWFGNSLYREKIRNSLLNMGATNTEGTTSQKNIMDMQEYDGSSHHHDSYYPYYETGEIDDYSDRPHTSTTRSYRTSSSGRIYRHGHYLTSTAAELHYLKNLVPYEKIRDLFLLGRKGVIGHKEGASDIDDSNTISKKIHIVKTTTGANVVKDSLRNIGDGNGANDDTNDGNGANDDTNDGNGANDDTNDGNGANDDTNDDYKDHHSYATIQTLQEDGDLIMNNIDSPFGNQLSVNNDIFSDLLFGWFLKIFFVSILLEIMIACVLMWRIRKKRYRGHNSVPDSPVDDNQNYRDSFISRNSSSSSVGTIVNGTGHNHGSSSSSISLLNSNGTTSASGNSNELNREGNNNTANSVNGSLLSNTIINSNTTHDESDQQSIIDPIMIHYETRSFVWDRLAFLTGIIQRGTTISDVLVIFLVFYLQEPISFVLFLIMGTVFLLFQATTLVLQLRSLITLQKKSDNFSIDKPDLFCERTSVRRNGVIVGTTTSSCCWKVISRSLTNLKSILKRYCRSRYCRICSRFLEGCCEGWFSVREHVVDSTSATTLPPAPTMTQDLPALRGQSVVDAAHTRLAGKLVHISILGHLHWVHAILLRSFIPVMSSEEHEFVHSVTDMARCFSTDMIFLVFKFFYLLDFQEESGGDIGIPLSSATMVRSSIVGTGGPRIIGGTGTVWGSNEIANSFSRDGNGFPNNAGNGFLSNRYGRRDGSLSGENRYGSLSGENRVAITINSIGTHHFVLLSLIFSILSTIMGCTLATSDRLKDHPEIAILDEIGE